MNKYPYRWTLKDEILIETPRMGFGANANLRVQNESILVFVKDGSKEI